MTTSASQGHLLDLYAEAVVRAPINLTSETDKAIFRQRHIGDALALNREMLLALPHARISRVLDVGSGNGIPGLVWAILHPEWQLNLLDSSNKKCLFLDSFCKNNALINVTLHCHRAEDVAHTQERETYDVVVCRALEKLPVALELTLPFVKTSGHLIVSHGTSWKQELDRAAQGLTILGGIFLKAIPYTIESTTFFMLLFEKKEVTPARYPRHVGIPTKRPL